MSYSNLSTLDKAIRVVVGLLMLAAGWSGLANGVARIGLEVFGWVPLATGAIGWCPIYSLLGISTRKPRAQPRDG
jgi:hypothetical protein